VLLTSPLGVCFERSLNNRFSDMKIRLAEFGDGCGKVQQIPLRRRFQDVERPRDRETS
jgi:hypothetical protein